jgi:hypothetical protein
MLAGWILLAEIGTYGELGPTMFLVLIGAKGHWPETLVLGVLPLLLPIFFSDLAKVPLDLATGVAVALTDKFHHRVQRFAF